MPGKIVLTVSAGPLRGQVFELTGCDTFLFGRSSDCHARLAADDTTASRHHFLLEVAAPRACLRDLGSLNGTWVNERRYAGRGRGEDPSGAPAQPQVELRHGDRIRVGHTVFEFAVESGPPADDLAPTVPPAPVPKPAGPASPDLVPGYAIERMLGRGGMGTVFLARRRSDRRPFAVKVVEPKGEVDERARAVFLREVEIAQRLRHPHVVEVYEHGASGASFHFVMEYCPGGSVDRLLRERGGPLPQEVALPVVLDALAGLAHAHREGIVHRDLKPENVLLAGAAGNAKLTDFGLAKSFHAAGLSGLTVTGSVGGTFPFMPREQLTNFKLLRPESDVWSMGATLYFLLTGSFPRDFGPDRDPLEVILRGGVVPLRRRDARLPQRLATVVDRALSDDPAERYRTAEELRRALEAAT